MEALNKEEFIQIAIKFLNYSFKDVDFTYQYLSKGEKEIIDEEKFNLLIKYIQDNEFKI